MRYRMFITSVCKEELLLIQIDQLLCISNRFLFQRQYMTHPSEKIGSTQCGIVLLLSCWSEHKLLCWQECELRLCHCLGRWSKGRTLRKHIVIFLFHLYLEFLGWEVMMMEVINLSEITCSRILGRSIWITHPWDIVGMRNTSHRSRDSNITRDGIVSVGKSAARINGRAGWDSSNTWGRSVTTVRIFHSLFVFFGELLLHLRLWRKNIVPHVIKWGNSPFLVVHKDN